MECPKPHPGHQDIPRALKGHKEKWAGPAGSANANAIKAATQNASSKYFRSTV